MTDGVSETRPGIAILRVSADGEVVAGGPGARALFGRRLSGACASVVAALAGSGEPVCQDGCAAALTRGEPTAARDRLGVLIRGRPARLRCERVGDELVVVARWWSAEAPIELLTPREAEVLGCVAAGKTDRAIALRLGLRLSTVRTHVEHARAKLGASTRAHAVARAIASGQLPPVAH